jgi:kynureninase
MIFDNTPEFARSMDEQDELRHFRKKYLLPVNDKGQPYIYFVGNSLGLQPVNARKMIEEELEVWGNMGVEGHFAAPQRPWLHYHKFSKKTLSNLVGAKEEEVVSLNNLTTNLHLLMVSFYRPSSERNKIVIESGAFPSDQYAVETQLKFHGLKPQDALIELLPRPEEHTLRTEDILKTLDENRNSIALVLLSGVQYYTGQFFDIQTITNKAHEIGAMAGFDLAHAIGNIPMALHDWNVDFATWCSYKYLNSGPGNVSGIFVHERHREAYDIPRFGGWWGHDEDERFEMKKGFKPMKGADGWQLSNVNVLSSAAHLAALELFEQAGMMKLRSKSILLTGYLEHLLRELPGYGTVLEILTPSEANNRGCQLSVYFKGKGSKVQKALQDKAILCDYREPDVVRVAPVPMYNTFEEVNHFSRVIKAVLDEK